MKQFQIIMAGCGDIAYRWLDHITKRDDCEIIAIAEKNPVRAENYIKRYNLNPVPPIYSSVEEALAKAKGNVRLRRSGRKADGFHRGAGQRYAEDR